ncbi:LysM peptidoglycan-binding domain-containing protein [Tessaracoccus sp. G1721]
MRALRALGAVLALAFLLLGIPWLLLLVGRPGALLTADWVTSLTVAMDSSVLVGALSAAAWLAWAVLAVTVVLEAVAVLTRQRVVVALPGTAWLRPLVGALVLAAVAAPTAAVADVGAAPAGPPDGADGVALSAPVTPVASVEQPAAPARVYVVQEGDELWGVAERELGEGGRWRELVSLNPGLSESSRLQAGARLALPEVPAVGSVVVEPGDTLWSIAGTELGDPERWPEIHELNRDQVTDPDQIDTGWVLTVPGANPAPQAAPAAAEPVAAAVPVEPAAVADESAVDESVMDASVVDASVMDAPDVAEAPAEQLTVPVITAPPVALPLINATPTPSEPAIQATEVASSIDESDDGVAGLLGPIGAVLAGSILAGVASRRRLQLLTRAMGRRTVPVAPHLARFWAALARTAEDAEPGLSPTTVMLGWAADGEPVTADLERERSVLFSGPASGPAIAALITGLTCTPWSDETHLVLVGGHEWAESLDDPRITALPGADEGLSHLQRLCSQRRLAMAGRTLGQLREDPDLAAAWHPVVVVFVAPLTPLHLDTVTDALALGEVGVSVVAEAAAAPDAGSTVVVDDRSGTWHEQAFVPQLLTQPAKRAVLDLFQAAGSAETEPAPWWRTDDLASNVTPLPHSPVTPEDPFMNGRPTSPEHPLLLLLGDVDLIGTRGAVPGRAVGQCMEYCAWLLEHPGKTPTAMTRALMIAETTRRSNVSRLRSWLGAAPDGEQYLPDAYSGRVALDPRVTSDWESFRTMLSGGVNVSSDAALVAALRLVRGEPLGSFEFQWAWAHELRTDMVAMIVDAACVLADRALDRQEAQAALWAVRRGRLAAPASDALAAREILALALAGRSTEAAGVAVALTRSARAEGRDLAPDLARRIQAALHAPSTQHALADA